MKLLCRESTQKVWTVCSNASGHQFLSTTTARTTFTTLVSRAGLSSAMTLHPLRLTVYCLFLKRLIRTKAE